MYSNILKNKFIDIIDRIWYLICTGGYMALNLRENVKPISYVKTNAVEMMNYVDERRNPIIITQNGEARAVLMDITTNSKNGRKIAIEK